MIFLFLLIKIIVSAEECSNTKCYIEITDKIEVVSLTVATAVGVYTVIGKLKYIIITAFEWNTEYRKLLLKYRKEDYYRI